MAIILDPLFVIHRGVSHTDIIIQCHYRLRWRSGDHKNSLNVWKIRIINTDIMCILFYIDLTLITHFRVMFFSLAYSTYIIASVFFFFTNACPSSNIKHKL